MDLKSRLKEARIKSGKSQTETAKQLSISNKTLSGYERGVSEPDITTLKDLAKAYNVSLNYLYGLSDQMDIPTENYRRINVYGSVPAGVPLEAIEDIQDWEDISFTDPTFSPNKTYIGLKVKGDSMYPTYLEGDTVIIEVTHQVDNNTDCVVYINGYEATLKKVTFGDNSITLTPLNTSYLPKTYRAEDDPVIILGKVVEIRRKI